MNPVETPVRPNQVLESMIDGDGDWDALLIERDLPVMDGFGVTAGFRDFEKARRNRASSQRTAAVEKHGRRPTRSYRHGMERDLDGEQRHTRRGEGLKERDRPISIFRSRGYTTNLRKILL